MRLTDNHLNAGWLHPRRVVRNAVAWHFTEALTTDPDVTAHAIRGAREFGWDQFLTWPRVLATLPLADDAAFEWVCGEVERTNEAAPSENLKGHLARMLVKAEIDLVERHRARLLAIPGLRPRERQTLITRLDLAMCAPDEAWRLLDDHCRMAAAGRKFADAKIEHAQLLLEPLERAGGETAARVMEVLASPAPDTDGDDPGDWLAGFMVALAGRLRLEEAATAIEEALRLEDDDDLRCHLGVAKAGHSTTACGSSAIPPRVRWRTSSAGCSRAGTTKTRQTTSISERGVTITTTTTIQPRQRSNAAPRSAAMNHARAAAARNTSAAASATPPAEARPIFLDPVFDSVFA